MAKMTVTGLDQYLSNLKQLSNEAEHINKGALGEGARVAADAIGNAIGAMPVRPDKPSAAEHDHKLYGVTANELAQIQSNFGIARFKNTGGGWNTSVGFHGYVNTPSRKFGDQVPTGMLVQCVEYGTDFRRPTRTLSRAIKSVKSSIPGKMQEYIDKQVKKIMK